MGLWEISFRCRYEFPLVRISSEFPGVPIYVWRLGERGWLMIGSREEAVLNGIVRAITRVGGVVEERADTKDSRVFRIFDRLPTDLGIAELFEEHSCQVSPPWMFLDGWGYFRMLSFDERSTSRCFEALRRLGTVELFRKTQLPLETLPTTVWIQGLVGGLSPRQFDALFHAHREGYYRRPRRTTTAKLAQQRGVVRSTFEEHLRQAENKVLDSLVGYVEFHGSGGTRVPFADRVGPLGTPLGEERLRGRRRRKDREEASFVPELDPGPSPFHSVPSAAK
jgi:predicted DNA binding protein